MRDRFTFFRSYGEALENLPDDERLKCYDAIYRYAIFGEEPELDGIAKGFFTLMKPNIDKSIKRAEAGKLGGESDTNSNQTESKPEANRKQNESKPEANSEKRASDKDKDKDIGIKDKEKDIKHIYVEIVGYLNEKAGKRYNTTTGSTIEHINGRMNDGYTVDDFKQVIDNKCKEWLGTEMEQYLRPNTLFAPSHFEEYLNQTSKAKPKQPVTEEHINLWDDD